MPSFGFLNRNNSKPKESCSSADANSGAPTATPKVDLSHLPPEEGRRWVRDRVLLAASAVYTRYGVDAMLALDEDPDLSKAPKAQKRDDQYAAHEAYQNRLQAILGKEALCPVMSTCLLLDPEESNADTQPSPTETTALPVHDVFACIALLLCNYTLLTASNSRELKSSGNGNANADAMEGGYDARVRNVLRMASIQLLAESLENNDADGTLAQSLEAQRQPRRTQVPVDNTETTTMEGVESEKEAELVDSKLADMMEAELQNDENTNTSTATESAKNKNNNSAVFHDPYRQYAARKFQSLEEAVADLMMTEMVQNAESSSKSNSDDGTNGDPSQDGEDGGGRFSRRNLVRAAKIGGVGVAAGALFAVTGGLAAPGIVAGLAALGVGGTALTLAASPAALIALFGVGGGGLSAYKMKRRTDGLTEFIINQENVDDNGNNKASNGTAHLHTTVCISGWLTDEFDFQRPWGVTPTNLSRLELLERFFSVVDPDRVKDAKELVKPFRGSGKQDDPAKTDEHWQVFTESLKEQYGKSPDELLPLRERAVKISNEEQTTLKEIFVTILQADSKSSSGNKTKAPIKPPVAASVTVLPGKATGPDDVRPSNVQAESSIRVWDYQSEYGGDLYTIQWESAMLLNMCRVADKLIKDLRNKAAKEVLKQTALATIMAALAWPSLLMGLAGALDNDWALITIRSDLAGVELARSLLQSNERRPVNLVGFSFGGRVIYACLRELARHQVIWEEQQQDKKNGVFKKKWKNTGDKDSIVYSREPASIVQDVIMMGTPLFTSRSKLRAARQMVAGRFVNCYSRKDWILSLMFQYRNASGIMRGTLGTGPVQGVSGIENYDVSSLVFSWHANYCRMVPDILDMVGFDQPMATEAKLE